MSRRISPLGSVVMKEAFICAMDGFMKRNVLPEEGTLVALLFVPGVECWGADGFKVV